MFERFTDRARRIVVLAQHEARQLNHNYIGTEHLLAAMAAEGEAVAAVVLTKFGIDLDWIREQIRTIIGAGQQAPEGHIPFTPRAKKVMELSLREALQLGHNYIGTEHMLLGLVREGEGVAAQMLRTAPGVVKEAKARGDSPDALVQVRNMVMQVLGAYPRATEKEFSGYGESVEATLSVDVPSTPHLTEELELIDKLREHVTARQDQIASAELTWMTEQSMLGAHEAREHETNQKLIDLHAKAVVLAQGAGRLLAVASELREELSKMIPVPPSASRDIEEEADEDDENDIR